MPAGPHCTLLLPAPMNAVIVVSALHCAPNLKTRKKTQGPGMALSRAMVSLAAAWPDPCKLLPWVQWGLFFSIRSLAAAVAFLQMERRQEGWQRLGERRPAGVESNEPRERSLVA